MHLLFILLHILGNNSRSSRLSGFNSRLGALRDFTHNALIWLVIFSGKRRFYSQT
jgi:hypothetical protein